MDATSPSPSSTLDHGSECTLSPQKPRAKNKKNELGKIRNLDVGNNEKGNIRKRDVDIWNFVLSQGE